jgi:DNA invertase Pin-like site-specific DNA recombinase
MSKRPGMTEALNFLSATGAQFLIVSHHDRLARNVDAANEIEVEVKRLGASVIYAEEFYSTGPYADFAQGLSRALADYRRAILQNG